MDQVRTFWTQIGRQRLLMMGGVAAAMLAVLAMVALRGGDERMGFLYTDLDPSSAQGIAEKLKGQSIPFQLSADGTSIMAPESKLAELRMAMAGDKLGGKIGYEVLDQEEPFGVSASRAKLNETRAIEGELSRSIQTLQNVTGARVHIVMPERAMFATSATKATAAVTVKTRSRLPAEAVQSIRYLVSSSVPELSPEAVSIVDQSGALLARAGDAATGGASTTDERQAQVEGRMRDEVEALLSPIVGQGKVRAEVSAEIDRDQTQEESEVYDPDKQVVAHVVTVAGKDQSNETNAAPAVASVATQLPDAQGKTGDGNGKTEAHDQTSEDTTYLNSKTHSVVTRGPGKIKRLTVAVMVDGGAKGLPAPQIQRLTRLVENAVGADTQRGDSVVIESMAFAADETLEDDGPGLLSKLPVDMLAGFGKLVLIAAVGLVAMKMIRAPGADKAAAATEAAAPAAPELEGVPQLPAGADVPRLPAADAGLAHIDGDVKIASLQRVGDAVGASPPEAAAVIRQWMNA
ncbi:flagellar basal-body MS-ring/collar protein FliF [Sphingomonas abaci]|uniref:Flagellar M-ring protein n=1 Tax=Sphingomonas abaci TaxID=237611 RepID=A0A7W7EWM0_9SPHN|nr:flagellar basal-body MS-ring/collar protein FliF [Sphingomonas abaci]MBB4616682.1 flagellar M-ring protein FliF [Sphingomonas abaci]